MRQIKHLDLKQGDAFRDELERAANIVVVSHSDLDGLLPVKMLLQSYGRKISAVFFTDNPKRDLPPEDEAQVLAADPDLVLMLDLAPRNADQLRRMLKGRRGLLVDHHKPTENLAVEELDDRFHTYNQGARDKLSTSLYISELLGHTSGADLIAAALLGDNTLVHFRDYFKTTIDELDEAEYLGKVFKKLGMIKFRTLDATARYKKVAQALLELVKAAEDLGALRQAYEQNNWLRGLYGRIQQDFNRLNAEVLTYVEERISEPHLLYTFTSDAEILVSGYIYETEQGIRDRMPQFKGLVFIVQETANGWCFDAMSTDPERHVGKILQESGLGGGHANAGGGVLLKSSGDTPEFWFARQMGGGA